MKFIETAISDTAIRVRYADQADAAKATEWIDLQVKIADVTHPSGAKISEPEVQYLGELEIAALDRALQIIQAEIRRLKNAGSAIF